MDVQPTTRPWTALAIALPLALAALPVGAQEPDFSHPTTERGSTETLMDRSDLGNVVHTGRLLCAEGQRELKRAAKLEKKLDKAAPGDRSELEEKIRAAHETAAAKFIEAIRTSPQMLEAYAGLGAAYRRLDKTRDSLEVYGAALRQDPGDAENFRGWAEAILELDMLGDAVQAYAHFETANPGHAEILLESMRDWLVSRRADPGDLAPEDVEKMAGWLDQNG